MQRFFIFPIEFHINSSDRRGGANSDPGSFDLTC